MYYVTKKRINAADNVVFDLYRKPPVENGYPIFVATIEVRSDVAGGIKVLLGALQPRGKELAFDAIRRHEGIAA